MRTGILGILFVCMLMSVSGAEIAIRQPEKPEWKIDLTDSCVRENGVRMADHLSRRRRTVRDDAGAVFRWSVSIDAPKQNAPHGVLLEFDNGDVVESLTVNGRPVARFPVKKPYLARDGAGGPSAGCGTLPHRIPGPESDAAVSERIRTSLPASGDAQ